MTSLRNRMIEDMQIPNLAVHTQNTYVLQVSMFARHFSRSPGGAWTGGDSYLPGLLEE
jgi:integrase/recombinase XerD